jgi:hypothetical protein
MRLCMLLIHRDRGKFPAVLDPPPRRGKAPSGGREGAIFRFLASGAAHMVHESPPSYPAVAPYAFTPGIHIVEVSGPKSTSRRSVRRRTRTREGAMLYAIIAMFLILSVISLISGHVASH